MAIKVKFIKVWDRYKPGDIAILDDGTANHMINLKRAVSASEKDEQKKNVSRPGLKAETAMITPEAEKAVMPPEIVDEPDRPGTDDKEKTGKNKKGGRKDEK